MVRSNDHTEDRRTQQTRERSLRSCVTVRASSNPISNALNRGPANALRLSIFHTGPHEQLAPPRRTQRRITRNGKRLARFESTLALLLLLLLLVPNNGNAISSRVAPNFSPPLHLLRARTGLGKENGENGETRSRARPVVWHYVCVCMREAERKQKYKTTELFAACPPPLEREAVKENKKKQ